MKDLTWTIVDNAIKGKSREVQVLCVRRAGLGNIGTEIVLSTVCMLDLSCNRVGTIEGLRDKFPNIWWLQLSQNELSNVDHHSLPSALGFLDLSSNQMTSKLIESISACHILRLVLSHNVHIFGDVDPQQRRSVIVSRLPNIWVLDEDFISFGERGLKRRGANMQQHVSNENDKLSFNFRSLNERETILIEMLQNAPSDPNICDIFRLEILLEDYLSQARTFNKHGCNYQGNGRFLNSLKLHMQR